MAETESRTTPAVSKTDPPRPARSEVVPSRAPLGTGPGNDPFPHSIPDFDKLKTAFRDFAKKQELVAGPLPQYAAIDRAFKVSNSAAQQSYRALQVEPLLDQALAIMTRCLEDRTEYDEKRTKAFSQLIDSQEYLLLDEIHQKEVIAGFYTYLAEQASAEVNAESALASGYADAAYQLSWLLASFTQKEINLAAGYGQFVAWMSGYPTYVNDQHEPKITFTLTDFGGQTGVSKAGTKPEINKEAAVNDLYRSLYVAQHAYESQQATARASAAASAANKDAKTVRAGWETKDVTFRRDRTDAARRSAELRFAEGQRPDGALNYTEQLGRIQDRFNADFSDAVLRCGAVATGLSTVYGYTDPLPGRATLDSYLSWARRASNWLAQFLQLEQAYVLPVSIRQLVGEGAWRAGLDSSSSGHWDPVVDEGLFPGQVHVRLRGASSFVRTNKSERLWQVAFRPPSSSFFRHLGNPSQKHQVSQDDTRTTRLTRVQTREGQREPDIGGVATLHNCSPFGTWSISVTEGMRPYKPGPGNFDPSSQSIVARGRDPQLDDVFLDMYVVVRQS